MKTFAAHSIYNQPKTQTHIHRLLIIHAETLESAERKLLAYQRDLTKNESALTGAHLKELEGDELQTLKEFLGKNFEKML